MTDMTVSRTILDQLGERKFIAMTGAHSFTGSPNALTFRLPGQGFTRNSINAVRVTLDQSDTYTVEFLRVRALKVTTVSTHTDIYCDQLCNIFERETGLRVSLGTMGVTCTS